MAEIIFYLLPFICVCFMIYQVFKYRKINENTQSFVATVSHDLKSPTRAQINILKMLLDGRFGELNPQQYEMIKLTCGSSNYMADLVGTILTKYECDYSMLRLNYLEFDLAEIIHYVCVSNECFATEKSQRIIFRSYVTDANFYGDRLQIQRVVSNFVNNAINHGFRDTIISVTLEKCGDDYDFSVTNKSNQISDKDLKSIFNKFSRVSNSKYNPLNTGLGLYISKSIIKLHGGRVYASSTNDGICTFGFILPIKKCQVLKTKVHK